MLIFYFELKIQLIQKFPLGENTILEDSPEEGVSISASHIGLSLKVQKQSYSLRLLNGYRTPHHFSLKSGGGRNGAQFLLVSPAQFQNDGKISKSSLRKCAHPWQISITTTVAI